MSNIAHSPTSTFQACHSTPIVQKIIVCLFYKLIHKCVHSVECCRCVVSTGHGQFTCLKVTDKLSLMHQVMEIEIFLFDV